MALNDVTPNVGVNPFTAGYLLSAQNATGTGRAIDARSIRGGYGAGFYMFQTSGNSASADFLVSHDSATWFSLTATSLGLNATGIGQFSGYYPFVAGRVTWVSGAANTGTVTLQLTLLS